MTDALRLRAAWSYDLLPAELDELTTLCEAAFVESFADAWKQIGRGLHIIGEIGGRLVAHALIVDRPLYVGADMEVTLDTGYVEAVATRPDLQRRGHGAQVMGEIGRIIRDEYALGALATGSQPFYAQLGWEAWSGPTWVRMPDGEVIRSADEDHHVMVMRTATTPPSLNLAAAIACDWRPGEPW